MRQNASGKIGIGNNQLFNTGFLQIANVLRRDPATLFHNRFTTNLDIKGRGLTAQTLGDQTHFNFFFGQEELNVLEERVEHFCVIQAQCTQDNGDRQLATTVNSRKDRVFRIELEVEP